MQIMLFAFHYCNIFGALDDYLYAITPASKRLMNCENAIHRDCKGKEVAREENSDGKP